MRRVTRGALLVLVAALTVTAPVGGALAAGSATTATATGTAVSTTLVVDDDRSDCSAAGYTSIAQAVNQSSSGDVIRVCAGTYVESVTIDHSLSLVGDAGAVLDGNGSLATGVRIAASDVTIDGLTIRGYTDIGIDTARDVRTISQVRIRDTRIEEIDPAGDVNAHRGIEIDGAADTVRTGWTIAGNTLVDTDSYGIDISASGLVDSIEVRNNEFRAVDQSAGLEAVLVAAFGSEPVRDVTITGNDVETDYGVRVTSNGDGRIEGTVIADNDFTVGETAIDLNPYCGVGSANCTAIQRGTEIRDNGIDAEDGVVIEVEDTARLRNLRIEGNAITASADAVRLASGTPAAAVEIHDNEFAAGAAFGVNNENATGVVNATGNDWGRPTGPSSPSDGDAPFVDPVTGAAANGSGAAVSEGATAGVSNVHFDPFASSGTITSCTVIDSPGRYVLGSDIHNSSAEVCINVTASDVVVDGAGHTVAGQSAFPSFGVLVDGNGRLDNVTVRNLRVADWATGIGYRNATGGRIAGVAAVENYDGIAFLGGSNVSVVDNRLTGNAYGIDLLSSTAIRIRNNTARTGDYGIRLRGTDGSRLVGNELRRHAVAGITLEGSMDNLLRNNTARNSTAGIELRSASRGNTLIDNRAIDNGRGIDVRRSDGNELEGTRLVGNGKGIRISGAAGIRLRDALARNNSRDFHAEAGSGAAVENLTLASATVSFEARDVAVDAVASPPAAPSGTPAIGRYVRVEATNENLSGFDPADSWAFLNVSYTDADASGVDESTLRLWRHNGTTGNWTLAGPPNAVDTTDNRVYANVSTFGVLAPLAGTGTGTGSGALEVTGLTAPATASVGRPITVTAEITNTGGANETGIVAFRFGGSTVASRNVTLSPGARTTVAFTTNASQAGNYSVAVRTDDDEREATVTVTSQQFDVGVSWGDPHLVTFGGLAYDFQAVGEYTLVRETSGDPPMVVQVRQIPVAGSNDVSITNATATRVDGRRVVIDAGDEVPLSIDGEPVALDPGETVAPGNGLIRRQGNTYTVYYPGDDGVAESSDEHLVVDVYANRLDLEIRLHPNRTADVEGLLGTPDGDAGNDVALANGTVLDRPLDADVLYGQFRSDWRIDPGASLFDYEGEQEPGIFFDAEFPAVAVSLDDLAPEARQEAARLAVEAGLEPGTATYRGAIIDYVRTGDSSYFGSARKADREKLIEASPGTGGLTVSLRPRNATVSVGGRTTFDLVAGNLTDGVSAYDLNVTVSNGSVARIVDVEYRLGPDPGAAASFNVTTPDVTKTNASATEVRLQQVGVRGDTGSVTLATVTLDGRAPNTATVSLSNVVIGDRNDSQYAIGRLESATVTVSTQPTPPDVNGNGKPARDPDNDGRHEDVDGDGNVNVIDVAVMLGAFDKSVIQDHVALFDYNGDLKVNILDVAALLGQV